MKRTIIGIDPGSIRMGFAVVQSENRVTKLTYAEVISAKASLPLYDRLSIIQKQLERRIGEMVPDEIAIEDIFYGQNARSAFHLGLARGVAVASCLRNGLPIFEYAPTKVKSIVTGHGRADKEQVKKMLELCLGMKLDVGLDATDAIAIAYCHSQLRPWTEHGLDAIATTKLREI